MLPLTHFDQVLLASDERSGKYEGAMLIKYQAVGDTPFLVIEALTGGQSQRNDAMLQRMLAYLILRFGTLHHRPEAILARTRNPSLCRVMRDVYRGMGGAGFYPEPDGSVISIRTAGLAHRAARQSGQDRHFFEARLALNPEVSDIPPDGPLLAMLDLRYVEEARLDDQARHLFRDRLPRSATRRPVVEVARLPALPAPLGRSPAYPIFRR